MPKHFTPHRSSATTEIGGRHPFRLEMDDRRGGRPAQISQSEPDEIKLFMLSFAAFFIVIYTFII